MERLYWWVVVLLVALWPTDRQECNASNILGLFPHFGYSHFKVYYPILRTLAEQGHNVTVVSYIKSFDGPLDNYEEFLIESKSTINVAKFNEFTISRSIGVVLHEYFMLHEEGQESCKKFYESGFVEKIMERHTQSPFDLVIMEYFNTDCYLGVPYMLQVPVVGLSSCALMPWYYDRILLPDSPSHVQSEFIGFPEELNWHERLLNFVQARVNTFLYRYRTNYYDNQIIKKYLKVDIDVNEVSKTLTSLIFVNQHYTLSGNRPQTPQLVEIGGVHLDHRRLNDTLPADVTAFLNKAGKRSVLFISWGSMLVASSIDPIKLKAIISVFEKLPFQVIWKWEGEKKPTKSAKFLFTKWAPQLSLLCHPKVKYFWGHGGLLGTSEAVFCGKPLIVSPVYGDQFLNANAVSNRKVGVILNHGDINEENVAAALQELMRPRYTENALALSQLFKNRPVQPLQLAVWWIEHLLQNGNVASEVLQTKAVHLNWFVYYSFDSISILLGLALLVVVLILAILRRLFFSSGTRQDHLSNKVKQN